MDIELIIGIIWLIGVLVLSITYNFNPSFAKNDKRLGLTFFIVLPAIIALKYLFYQSTDTLYDAIIVIIYFCSMIYIINLIDNKTKNSTFLSFIFYSILYVIIFLCIRQINKHLLDSIDCSIIFVLLFVNIININKNDNHEILIGAHIIGVLIVCIMFGIFSESYQDTTKQEYIVRNYLIENEGYKQEEILEITLLSPYPIENKERRIFVKTKSESYIYHYKMGKIIQKELLTHNDQ